MTPLLTLDDPDPKIYFCITVLKSNIQLRFVRFAKIQCINTCQMAFAWPSKMWLFELYDDFNFV